MLTLPTYILAGGRSSRFGSDKARALIGNTPLIQHLCQSLAPLASSITVVAEVADKYADLNLRTIADLAPGQGPKGGLQTALRDLPATQSWLLLCPCDVLRIKPEWLARWADLRADADAVAFKDQQFWQPLPALYARTCLPVVEQQLTAGQRSMQTLLNQIRTAPLPLPPDWAELGSINTPEELKTLQTNATLQPPK